MNNCKCLKSTSLPISSRLKYLSKLLPKKTHFPNWLPQKMHFQNCSLKKYIIKIALSKNTLSKLLSQKYIIKISKNIFSKLLRQKHILIALIYSSSESLEKLSKSSIICLITFFLFQCIYTLLKTLVDNSFHLS